MTDGQCPQVKETIYLFQISNSWRSKCLFANGELCRNLCPSIMRYQCIWLYTLDRTELRCLLKCFERAGITATSIWGGEFSPFWSQSNSNCGNSVKRKLCVRIFGWTTINLFWVGRIVLHWDFQNGNFVISLCACEVGFCVSVGNVGTWDGQEVNARLDRRGLCRKQRRMPSDWPPIDMDNRNVNDSCYRTNQVFCGWLCVVRASDDGLLALSMVKRKFE